MFPTLKEVRDSLENSYFANQLAIEKQAVALYNTDKAKAISLLNQYSNDKSTTDVAPLEKPCCSSNCEV